MARGSVAKTMIGTAILQIFPGSFIDGDGKTVRIPTTCEGEPIEIKVSFVAAKDIIGSENASSIAEEASVQPQNRYMTEEEIAEVKRRIADLKI